MRGIRVFHTLLVYNELEVLLQHNNMAAPTLPDRPIFWFGAADSGERSRDTH